jgi:hypothetical protein
MRVARMVNLDFHQILLALTQGSSIGTSMVFQCLELEYIARSCGGKG